MTIGHRLLGCDANGTALRVSEQGFGSMSLTNSYGIADEADAVKTVTRALELGVTFFDTADAYGPLRNEQLLGGILRQRREDVVIGTKFGMVLPGHPEPDRRVDGRPEYARQAVDASLSRLGVDHIDIYYLHRVDPQVPIEDTVGALAELVSAGKIRHIGLSEPSAATIRRAHDVHPITAIQSEFSLWTRDPEAEVLPTVRELGIGFVAFSPLGRGMLADKLDTTVEFDVNDTRRAHPRFQGTALKHNVELVGTLRRLADARSITVAQLALAWVMAQGTDIAPIPGTKRPHYVEENIAAGSVALSPAELAEIEATFPAAAVLGERHPEMDLLNG